MQMMPQMAYDRAITVFSPDGRLFQVEYAREAVKRGTTAIGIKATDGVALLVDKRVTSRLLEAESVEKIFKIDDHIGAATSGLVADARVLIDRARVEAQINRMTYNESMGVEALAKRVCDHMQTYTQYGGVRPYGTALLIAGVNDDSIRLFETDPSGTLLEYKATGIGAGRNVGMEVFEAQYRDDLDLDGAILLGLEALHKAAEGKLSTQTVEIGVVELKTKMFKKMTAEDTNRYVQQVLEQHPSESREKT
ncbi:MAG: archaeal proteasome endopeptidase complex subunit alpha [Methanocellales archaeon]|nr:archaeal proteasome endopeptidase complex subunit alpha [Methanocellales archaeon]